MTVETYKVNGMHCVGCGRAIRKLLEKNKYVESVVTDTYETTIVVTYDEAHVDRQFILDSVGRFGYKAVKKETQA